MKRKQKTREPQSNRATNVARFLLVCAFLYFVGVLLNYARKSTQSPISSPSAIPATMPLTNVSEPSLSTLTPILPTYTSTIMPTTTPSIRAYASPVPTLVPPTSIPTLKPAPEVVEVDLFIVHTNRTGALLHNASSSILYAPPDYIELSGETRSLPGNLDSVGVFGVAWLNSSLWFYAEVCDTTGYIGRDCATYQGWVNANDVHLLAGEEAQQHCGSECWADFHLYRITKDTNARDVPLMQIEGYHHLKKGTYILASHATREFVGYRGLSWKWVQKDHIELVW